MMKREVAAFMLLSALFLGGGARDAASPPQAWEDTEWRLDQATHHYDPLWREGWSEPVRSDVIYKGRTMLDMRRKKYTCCRCGAAAEYLDEDTGALYCGSCIVELAWEKLDAMNLDDLEMFVGLVPLGEDDSNV